MKQIRSAFKQMAIWFTRIRYRKGYGVQSPFAYNFICDVINNREMYYAYEPLKETRHNLSEDNLCHNEKLDKMFFRLANFARPKSVVMPIERNYMTQQYVKAGCNKATIYGYGDLRDLRNTLSSLTTVGMLFLSSEIDAPSAFEMALPKLQDGSIVITEGIRHNRQGWKQLRNNLSATLTFDLYDIGIVLVWRDFNKQNYIVNF